MSWRIFLSSTFMRIVESYCNAFLAGLIFLLLMLLVEKLLSQFTKVDIVHNDPKCIFMAILMVGEGIIFILTFVVSLIVLL